MSTVCPDRCPASLPTSLSLLVSSPSVGGHHSCCACTAFVHLVLLWSAQTLALPMPVAVDAALCFGFLP